MKKLFSLFWILLVPCLLLYFLNEIYYLRAIDLTKNWQNLEANSYESTHMASNLVRYQRLIISSEFVRGVAIFDSSLKLLSSFGEVSNHSFQIFPKTNEVYISRTGLFSYATTFIAGSFDQKYMVIFYFKSQLATAIWLAMSIALIFIFLAFIILSFWQTRVENKGRISIVINAIEAYAHDIGSTLNWSKNLAEMVCDGDRKELRNLAQYVQKSLRYAFGLRSEMLSLSKPSLDEQKLLDLKEVYRQSRDLCLSDTSKFEIREKFHHTLRVSGDELKLSRVIINLLQNAYKYSSGYISISTKNMENGILFEIVNDGQEIPSHIKCRIFDPFVTTSGVGLGLFICRSFIALHGGYMKVCSNESFTKFSFWLPGSQRIIETASLDPVKLSSVKVSIAVIDDEVQQLERVSSFFKNEYVEIETFSHVDYFYNRLLEYRKFDYIIVDRLGPGFDAVLDNFPEVVRNEFGFSGKIILYSNSKLDDKQCIRFDKCISKEQVLNLEMLRDSL